jgi:hypothetical protein
LFMPPRIAICSIAICCCCTVAPIC